jgi:hypothetical protein
MMSIRVPAFVDWIPISLNRGFGEFFGQAGDLGSLVIRKSRSRRGGFMNEGSSYGPSFGYNVRLLGVDACGVPVNPACLVCPCL